MALHFRTWGLTVARWALFICVPLVLGTAGPAAAAGQDDILAAIRDCRFAEARLMMERGELAEAQRQSLAEQLKWAEETEQVVRDWIVTANRNWSVASGYMKDRQYQAALFEYEAARETLYRARQRVECRLTRDVIDAMIAHVGHGYAAADDILSGRWDDEETTESRVLPGPEVGPHPCLDPDYPERASLQLYSTMGIGPGGVLKSEFICGPFEDFGAMTSGGIELYRCEKAGNQYLNCEQWAFDPQTNVRKVEDGTEFHYTRDQTRMMGGQAYWILLKPHGE